MSATPWWVVLVAAAIGATAGVVGSAWASRVQRVSTGRAEWFRRLQWAWELSESGDDRQVTVGAIMLDHLAKAADQRDVVIIARIAPIARLVGRFTDEYPAGSPDVDFSATLSDTGNTGEHGQEGSYDED